MFQIPTQMLQALLVTVGLICLDTLLGWTGALVKGTWDWKKIGQFLQTSVLPYIGGLLALAALAVLQPDTTAVFYASVAAADVKLAADIIGKIAGFGVPVVEKPEGTNGKE